MCIGSVATKKHIGGGKNYEKSMQNYDMVVSGIYGRYECIFKMYDNSYIT